MESFEKNRGAGLRHLICSIFVVALGSSVGFAQCNPGNGVGGFGPDVIVGEMTTPQSYGTAGGFYAYSVGTTSCNIGTAELDWISSTNDHPVIAQNFYRLHEGKFEQIGMSWLKHGFAALQGNTCGCGCNPGSGSALGVGCSDPYGAGLNGSQFSLGARSEVFDPANGTFTYPRILDPPAVDLTTRRLRVRGPDLDPAIYPGARYFVEAHYVAKDDALAGNAHNNASYREVSVSSNASTRAITYITPTQRQLQAIRAWGAIDPEVTLVDIHDGEGGLFILGYKVSEIGASGLYAYEYALYNMNSTRAARSFAVPLQPGVVISDIEFNDVEYHSTEVYDGTDWTPSTAGGNVSWTTSTAAIDPEANALRWGTLYNFRFTANSPPGPANVEIGMFEPGLPAGLAVAVLGPSAGNLDCNGNGTLDSEEILAGAADCDSNGLLDECQNDCDGNGSADNCEFLAGTQFDCNGDFIPDACQITAGDLVDCDGDLVPDICQIANGQGTDCDGDGGLDSCQVLIGTLADCDADGLADICQILDDPLNDCDADGGLDLCQGQQDPSLDCDQNGVLDLCETPGFFSFPVSHSPGLFVGGGPPTISTVSVGNTGVIEDIDVAVRVTHPFIGQLQIDVVAPSGTEVRLHNSTGGTTADLVVVYDDEGTTVPAQPLSAFDGELAAGTWSLEVADTFPTIDDGTLDSWVLVVGIAGAGFPDCNANGTHDDCELDASTDCNGNGVLDSCDIATGTSLDADLDGIPDECGPMGPEFIRGDANADGLFDIADPIAVLAYLFSGGGASCEAALDANGSDAVDIADGIALLSTLFSGGTPPVSPYPGCGIDLNTTLSCAAFPACP